ncbi:Cadherin-23 [Varanus komodoensis]|nr:Cadherin-23 [Varanus komodoensis]
MFYSNQLNKNYVESGCKAGSPIPYVTRKQIVNRTVLSDKEEEIALQFKGIMKYQLNSRNLFLVLLFLESVCFGLSNRLPYFINYFFDTYLLINEDTPVGECIKRIARRDQNVFLNEHCKETEENNRIGRTRDLFKKIGDMKGMFHAKMGMIKDQNGRDQNGRDLTETEEIKKRWQDYTEELYKKELNVPDNYDGVVTDLEPDILECEVKWALGSLSNNRASGEHIVRKAELDESPVGIKIAGRNINNLRYADDTTLMAESEEELKSLLMQVKEESAKVGLKLNIKKPKIMASSPLTSWQIDGEEMEVGTDFIFLGSKITADRDCSQEIKDACSWGGKLWQIKTAY